MPINTVQAAPSRTTGDLLGSSAYSEAASLSQFSQPQPGQGLAS